MSRDSESLLPLERFDAVLFDMDGVVTDTAGAHAAAWKRMFDDFLEARAQRGDAPLRPFDEVGDYRRYVDGKPRYDGVRSFLAARGIDLPEGDPDDGSDRETVHGLGRRKNEYFLQWLDRHRVCTYDSTLALIDSLRRAGKKVAVFSSSRNAGRVLDNAGVLALFDAKVDGQDAAALGLPGKPDPAVLEAAAARVGASAQRSVVVEDSTAGVKAAKRGGFGLVVGVDRSGALEHDPPTGTTLRSQGADLVVSDLADLTLESEGRRLRNIDRLPDAWESREALQRRWRGSRLMVFLDYDGTLTPIVQDYAEALLDEGMRAALKAVAKHCPVAIVSGRDLAHLRNLVRLEEPFLAGSHGFEIAGPQGRRQTLRKGTEFLPDLDRAESELRSRLAEVPGHDVERKAFAIAVHYRRVADADVPRVEAEVDRVVAEHPRLRKGSGKRVFQVQPRTDWDKGRAMKWILERVGPADDVAPVYIGDDVTDEDAFRALGDRGVGIVVRDGNRMSSANFSLADPMAVRRFLEWLAGREESADE